MHLSDTDGWQCKRGWVAAVLLFTTSLAAACSEPPIPEGDPVGVDEEPSPRSQTAEKLKDYLLSQVAQGFSGVVLIDVSGDVILHDSYGPPDRSFDRDACFWIASVSKMFTAATAVALHEEGELELRDSIDSYLDRVPADKRAITMHHLLTHTSGLDSTYVAEGITSRSQAIDALLATPLAHPVGSTYLYSSDGYSLAALIIETVRGQPFEDVVQETVLTPLGMRASGFWGLPIDPSACALVPWETASGIATPNRVPNYGFRGPTGMRSTATDLRRWYQALIHDELLSAESRRMIFTPHVEKALDVAYGYGWNIVQTTRGTRMLAHSGQDDVLKHVSYLYAFPDEDVLMILLTDSSTDVGNETLRGVRSILFP